MSPSPKRNALALIGYRGTGKTTISKLLAERLGWSWVDADEELERNAGKTIKEIFATQGEQAFRDLEAEVVQDLCQREKFIVAFGGGAILREENRRAICRNVVVWLTADVATIAARVTADPATSERRPNLTVGGAAEIEQLLAVRQPLYRECADYVVETVDKTPDQIASEIVCLLGQRAS